MLTTKTKAILNLLLLALTLAVNALGALGLINGLSQKAVSDRYDTLITPSPFAFSIWGVLYLLLLATMVYWLIKHKEGPAARAVDTLSPLFFLTCAFNMAWIAAFSYELIGLSTLFILGLAVSLALINRKLASLYGMAARLGGLSMGMYTGWILVASFINAAAFLVKGQWQGLGLSATVWAIIILALALLGTLLIQLRLRNAALTLPIAWAYYGIYSRHSASGFWQGQYPQIAAAALIGAILALAMALWVFLWNKRCVLPLREKQAQP